MSAVCRFCVDGDWAKTCYSSPTSSNALESFGKLEEQQSRHNLMARNYKCSVAFFCSQNKIPKYKMKGKETQTDEGNGEEEGK